MSAGGFDLNKRPDDSPPPQNPYGGPPPQNPYPGPPPQNPYGGPPPQNPYGGPPPQNAYGAPPPQNPYGGNPYGSQQPFPNAPYGNQPPLSASDSKMWALFAHLGGILFGFLAPLIIYVMYKDRDPFVRQHSAQALNFQILLLIVYVVSAVLVLFLIGILTFLAAWVCAIVFGIMGAIAANNGQPYKYPINVDWIK